MQYPTASEGAAPQMQLYISSDIDLIIMFFVGPIQLGISPGFGLIWSQVLPHGIEVLAMISQFLLYLREAIQHFQQVIKLEQSVCLYSNSLCYWRNRLASKHGY